MKFKKWTKENYILGLIGFFTFTALLVLPILLVRVNGVNAGSDANGLLFLVLAIASAVIFYTLVQRYPKAIKRRVKMDHVKAGQVLGDLFRDKGILFSQEQHENGSYRFDFPDKKLSMSLHPYEPRNGTVGTYDKHINNDLLPFTHTLVTLPDLNGKNRDLAEKLATAVNEIG